MADVDAARVIRGPAGRDPPPPPQVRRAHCQHCAQPIWHCYPIAHDWAWHGYDWPHDHCDNLLTDRRGGRHEPSQ